MSTPMPVLDNHNSNNYENNTNNAQSRLFSLRCVVQDALADPEVASINPGVAKALATLNDTLQRFTDFDLHPSSQAHSPSGHKDHATTGPSTSGIPIPLAPEIPDERLRKAVFTHSACSAAHDTNYDRLEVLGDAYIELIATKLLWKKFPGIPAGRMSQIREKLVKNETLAAFSETYGFDRKALVPANYSSQPKRWMKTKGDIFEAYVAAVILSHSEADGYKLVERWLASLWLPELDRLGHQKATLRSKEILAQQIMGRNVRLEYLEERPSVQKRGSGTQTFFIGVYLTGWGWTKRHLGSGHGPSKVAAGDEAAQNALLNTPLITEIAAEKKKQQS
ncbi:hypothetical protein N7539_000725 [Penicillium diatomitis]|uniref:RNase III domain-containing protein n=1 Tax=Penicillium diatomitis TaxID=2819901 RepID=A0A9X0C305_9EURO|nr:uncharacterized protein N7539_000725 [Penicillium diatomitis]KAJ5495609.1 hypothetical protein N7539_000725 [Penicillium diatomitis]